MDEKIPYDDNMYLEAQGAIERNANIILSMEGSDKSTVKDVFDQILDNLEDE